MTEPNRKYPKTVISLVGLQGSGKSTLGQYLAKYLRTKHIEASSVVREIVGDIPRFEMPETNLRTKEEPFWLSQAIEERFPKDKKVVVLTGIRELVIEKYLEARYDIYSFEIHADAEIRFQRQLELSKCINAEEFIRHELNEMKLDTLTLMLGCPYLVPTSPTTDPQLIIKAMVKSLSKAGAELN